MTSAVAQKEKFCPACRERFPDDGVYCPNDGSPLVAKLPDEVARERPDPYVGRTILDHIEIGELAGIGAMGRVYRAFQKGIDRDVAVKVLHRELSANTQLVSRFLREAKVASRLQHPNVVHVLLSGQLPDGALYIVMEYLHGLSLQSAIAEAGGAFDLSRALHVALQLCDAVGEAHIQGIVHRDLKPENVMLVRRGQDADFVKVLDFGIARLNWSEQSMATATGLIFGTARYISPEGAQGEKVGPPGDVYSIATLAYQMLAARTPFEGDQAVGLLIQQIHEPPPPLRSHAHAREVPPAIADVVMRGLAKNPDARFESARAFGRALVEAARASGVAGDDYYSRALFAAPGPPSAGARSSSPSSEPGLAKAPHPPSQSTRDLGDVPAAGPTARWTPPAAVQAQLAAVANARAAARAPAPSNPGNVDQTLDDDDVQSPPTLQQRTEYVTPAPHPTPLSGTVRLPPGEQVSSSWMTPTPAPVRALAGGKGATLPLSTGANGEGDTPPRHPAPVSHSSPQLVLTPAPSALLPEDSQEPARRGRTFGIIVLCFLIGVGGAVGLHRSGFLARMSGSQASTALLDQHLTRVREAIDRERWDSPPGDNVRDLITNGLSRWPNEPRLIQIRGQAEAAMIRRAVALKSERDLAKAARIARLASDLVPEDETTRALAAEYAHELETTAPPLPSVTPPRSVTPPTAVTPANGNVRPPSATGAKVSLETSPPKPRLAQPVQLTARIVGTRAPVADATFFVVVPGQSQGVRLVPVAEGSVYRASFTFLEAGRYEVSFVARAESGSVKTAKTIVVEGPSTTPEPTPQPSGSVKWL